MHTPSYRGDAGSEIAVTWDGPDNPRDFVSIDPAGAEDRTYGNYAYTSSGNPLTLRVPDEAGDYAVRASVRVPYQVIHDGTVIANGAINGEPIELEPGSYDVRVLTNPPRNTGTITIESGEEQEHLATAGD